MDLLNRIKIDIQKKKVSVYKIDPILYSLVNQKTICGYIGVRNDYLSPGTYKRVKDKKRYIKFYNTLLNLNVSEFVEHLKTF